MTDKRHSIKGDPAHVAAEQERNARWAAAADKLGQQMTWKPISTAPKDGTPVDVWVNDYGDQFRVADAWWHATLGSWMTRDGSKILGVVTHYMPLPPPPTEENK
jgi:hypothetical protein